MTPRRRTAIAVAVVVVAVVVMAVGGVLIGAIGLPASGTTPVAPHFVSEAAEAGLVHTYSGDEDYATGGGVAAFDCNDDGRPEMYLAGGAGPAVLERNDSAIGGPLRFTPVQDPLLDRTGVLGAYPLDVDGDGRTDLAILGTDGATMLRGLGGCTFSQADEAWSFDGGDGWATAFSATWEGAAAAPTLAIGRYVDPASSVTGTTICDDNTLVRPVPGGRVAYGAPLSLAPSFCTLSMLFSDWDGSGRSDLRISNDRQYYDNEKGGEQLWRLDAGTPPRLYTAADGWELVRIWGMGIASYDLTGDGYPEVYLTSQGENRLQTLADGPSQPTYADIALKSGVNATRPFTGGDPLPSTAWHPEFEDVNNDGLIDLFVSKGNVNAIPDYATKDPSNLLLGQPDGTFQEGAGAAGIVTFDRGRGAALVDFNLDGLLDLVQVNYGQPVDLWRNVGSGTASQPAGMGSWLALRLHQPGPNRDAIGARLEVRTAAGTMSRELTVGGGHTGGQLGWVHEGLGGATSAEVRVTWPDGQVGPWLPVSTNQFVDLNRASGAAIPWTPPATATPVP